MTQNFFKQFIIDAEAHTQSDFTPMSLIYQAPFAHTMASPDPSGDIYIYFEILWLENLILAPTVLGIQLL